MHLDLAITESVESRTCNAVRIEPFLVGHGGNAYWKLNCFGSMLRQGKLYYMFCFLLVAI